MYKQLWVKALREGGYRQGQESLHYRIDEDSYPGVSDKEFGDFYCCLGVFQHGMKTKCNIVVEDDSEGELLSAEEWDRYFYIPNIDKFFAATNKFGHDISGERHGENVETYGDQYYFAMLNDRAVSFSVIADLIEEFVFEKTAD